LCSALGRLSFRTDNEHGEQDNGAHAGTDEVTERVPLLSVAEHCENDTGDAKKSGAKLQTTIHWFLLSEQITRAATKCQLEFECCKMVVECFSASNHFKRAISLH